MWTRGVPQSALATEQASERGASIHTIADTGPLEDLGHMLLCLPAQQH